MEEIRFLTFDDIIYIHEQEIALAGTSASLRSKEELLACIESPKVTFDGYFLMDIFEMATSYIINFTIRHPFTDGNKRVALASCLTFLIINGIELEENHELEFADLIFDFLGHKITKEKITEILKHRISN